MKITEVKQIDAETECGKLLLAAIAIIRAETNKTSVEVIEQLNKARDEFFGVVA